MKLSPEQKAERLRQHIVSAEARAYDANWIVRMEARKELEKLNAQLKRAEKACEVAL